MKNKYTERAENMKAILLQNLLIEILRSELNETEPDRSVKDQLTPDVILALFLLSKQHDLAHMVSSSLCRSGLLGEGEMLSKFEDEEGLAVYRNAQMQYTYGEVCNAFEQASIPYIPLKGSVLRTYYPRESMRTSCDIDILIQEEMLASATAVLERLGFLSCRKKYHDVSFYAPNDMHLELHFRLLENLPGVDAILKDAWLYAKPREGCRYEFAEEFFLFHIFAHMSYHFLSGGCGIRALMDLWVMKHKMGLSFHQAKELLERAGLYRFAEEMSKLSEICFSGDAKDDFSDVILSYLFEGGVYGSTENQIAVRKLTKKNTATYALQRLFMPYRKMTILFPILKKLPFLLPVCWVIRWVKVAFGGRVKGAVTELQVANRVSEDELERLRQIQEKLGLQMQKLPRR